MAPLKDWLEFDGAAERCTGHGAKAATALLTRDYRRPFVVPRFV